MTENSKIEWCDATWQVTHGCKKVAAGCANCYAIRDAHRMAGHPNAKISEPRQGLTKWVHRSPNERAFVDWTGVVRTAPENLDWPLRKKKPLRIFVNSNSDLFHDAVPFAFIAAVYGVMAACPQHTFIILTKRPKRMREFMEWSTTERPGTPKMNMAFEWDKLEEDAEAEGWPDSFLDALDDAVVNEPLKNVIHGYSAANQADLDTGIADLLATPSALRCLSLEPLIGPVDLSKCITCRCDKNGNCDVCLSGGIDWVITGGESGPGARPCDVAWIRSIVQQCQAAGAPCFVKQLGSRSFDPSASDDSGCDCPQWTERCEADDHPRGFLKLRDRKGADPSEWPADLRVREWPEVAHG